MGLPQICGKLFCLVAVSPSSDASTRTFDSVEVMGNQGRVSGLSRLGPGKSCRDYNKMPAAEYLALETAAKTGRKVPARA